jgi:hypothetical protein
MRNPYPPIPSRLPLAAFPANASPQPGKRTALIALQEEVQFPSQHGLVSARRMKLMRVEQAAVSPDVMTSPHAAIRARTPVSVQVAPAPLHTLEPSETEPAELEWMMNGQRVHLRSVDEAMADEAGNLYEVHGWHMRPLGQLVSDERGRIFEVQPAREVQSTATHKPRANANESEHGVHPAAPSNGQHSGTTAQPTHTRVISTELSPAYRTIVTDPGLYLKLPWARIKGELAPQLQHPEKLRDDELLECYAQIYEAQRTMPAAQLAALALGDAALASQLHPFTQARAQMLGAPQLFKPTDEPFEMRATHRQIYAGQRVYRLWPVFDPTIERDNYSSRPFVASAEKEATLRTQIPQQYLNPLQFKYSREEVLYDMKGLLGTLPPESHALARWLFVYPLRLLKALITPISSHRRMRKWRSMLKGKSPDEQLWAVTPPCGFSYHPAVRRWAEETLLRAGSDPHHMFVEWEIFWRRKGWT